MPTSSATFSLGDHCACPPRLSNHSRISVEGVPGYPVPNFTPASKAAVATASSPLKNNIAHSRFRTEVFLRGWNKGSLSEMVDRPSAALNHPDKTIVGNKPQVARHVRGDTTMLFKRSTPSSLSSIVRLGKHCKKDRLWR